jgi:hypothetical protein
MGGKELLVDIVLTWRLSVDIVSKAEDVVVSSLLKL